MPIGHLVIRTDANSVIGLGHLMRCLALAQAWKKLNGLVTIIHTKTRSAISERLNQEEINHIELGCKIGGKLDAAKTAKIAHSHNARWIILDGYNFGSDYQLQLKSAGFKLLLLDDCGCANAYNVDIILNQNLGASQTLYKNRAKETVLLLGSNYVLLRKEFCHFERGIRRPLATAKRLLVTFGGSDPKCLTEKVLDALRGIESMNVIVVVGSANVRLSAIRKQVAGLGQPVQLVVDPPEMPELMAWADVAVSAAGSTSWELAYMGLPSLFIVAARNQIPIAKALSKQKIGHLLGYAGQISTGKIRAKIQLITRNEKMRKQMSRNGQKLIDGNGSNRVAICLGGQSFK